MKEEVTAERRATMRALKRPRRGSRLEQLCAEILVRFARAAATENQGMQSFLNRGADFLMKSAAGMPAESLDDQRAKAEVLRELVYAPRTGTELLCLSLCEDILGRR